LTNGWCGPVFVAQALLPARFFAVSTPPGVAVPPDLVARLATGGYIEIPDFMIRNGEDLHAG